MVKILVTEEKTADKLKALKDEDISIKVKSKKINTKRKIAFLKINVINLLDSPICFSFVWELFSRLEAFLRHLASW